MELNYNPISNLNYNSFIWAYHKKINPPTVKEEDSKIERKPIPVRSDLENFLPKSEIQEITGPKKKPSPSQTIN